MSTYWDWMYEHKDDQGRLHCENGPARSSIKLSVDEYWQNGLRHRLDGPAVDYNDKLWNTYYIFGVKVSKELFETVDKTPEGLALFMLEHG